MSSLSSDSLQSHRPALAAFASLLCSQTGAAFAKTIFPLVGPEGIAALRVIMATLVLGALLRPWTLKPTRADWGNLLVYGVMMGLMNILVYRAFAYIPVGIAISIEVLGPLGVSLLASRRRLDLVWIALALCGLALLPIGALSGGLDWRGVAFALASGVCWGMYVMFGGRVAHLGGRGVTVGMALGALFLIPLGVAHAGAALLQPSALVVGLAAALLSSALPFLLDIYALRKLPKGAFGILMSASPAVSALAGLLILGERLQALQWLGVLCIMGACLGCALASMHPALQHAETVQAERA